MALPFTSQTAATRLSTGFQHTTANLVKFDRFDHRLEMALAETVIALALDHFKEDRPDHGIGEDLQQFTAFGRRRAVEEDPVPGQTLEILAMPRQPAKPCGRPGTLIPYAFRCQIITPLYSRFRKNTSIQ